MDGIRGFGVLAALYAAWCFIHFQFGYSVNEDLDRAHFFYSLSAAVVLFGAAEIYRAGQRSK